MSTNMIVDTILKVLVEELIKYEPEIQKFLQDELDALGKLLTDYLTDKFNTRKTNDG